MFDVGVKCRFQLVIEHNRPPFFLAVDRRHLNRVNVFGPSFWVVLEGHTNYQLLP